ncbi:MAG: type II toxin-antitoxin system VapC family toxin [Spirochaetales bacterium]
MNLLIDTHIFLWAINEDPRLTGVRLRLFRDPGNTLYLSMASVWEVFLKASTGKLVLKGGEPESFVRQQMELNRIQLLPIRLEHTAQVVRLPWHHKDPFDRLLIAQSQLEKLPLLTVDGWFAAYDVELVG